MALFDELILLSEGKIIYNGPVEEVVEYFNALGYEIPERMDVADWLQALPTKDGAQFMSSGAAKTEHLTTDGFVEKFNASTRGQQVLEMLAAPVKDGTAIENLGASRYKNPWYRSLRLLVQRELLLWWRDKYQIKATLAKGKEHIWFRVVVDAALTLLARSCYHGSRGGNFVLAVK